MPLLPAADTTTSEPQSAKERTGMSGILAIAIAAIFTLDPAL